MIKKIKLFIALQILSFLALKDPQCAVDKMIIELKIDDNLNALLDEKENTETRVYH